MTRYPVAPAKCRCGRKPVIIKLCLFHVYCHCGWRGPERRTERGAVTAWNRVMAKHEGRAR